MLSITHAFSKYLLSTYLMGTTEQGDYCVIQELRHVNIRKYSSKQRVVKRQKPRCVKCCGCLEKRKGSFIWSDLEQWGWWYLNKVLKEEGRRWSSESWREQKSLPWREKKGENWRGLLEYLSFICETLAFSNRDAESHVYLHDSASTQEVKSCRNAQWNWPWGGKCFHWCSTSDS